MLTIIDGGCDQHVPGEIKITGAAAELIGDIIRNLPKIGDYSVFICQHGHTHHMIYDISTDEISGDVVDVTWYHVVN